MDQRERAFSRRLAVAFDAVLERFVKESPVSIMARLMLQRAVSAEWMDSLFERIGGTEAMLGVRVGAQVPRRTADRGRPSSEPSVWTGRAAP